jgi:hypothetical protein
MGILGVSGNRKILPSARPGVKYENRGEIIKKMKEERKKTKRKRSSKGLKLIMKTRG